VLAEEKIIRLLDDVKEDGILQSEIPRILNLSKSTVSEILSDLESRGEVIRKGISARSYRVWKAKYFPSPFPGLLRLGILKSTEYAYLIIAALKNNVIVKLFDDPIDLTRALSQGRVDMAASPLLTQVIMGILMKNFKIFRIVAKNGSGIVFSNSKTGIFGTTEMSTMDRNLRKFLTRHGGKRVHERVHYFNSPKSMIESLKSGEIEGLAIWEPYLTMLKEDGFEIRHFNEVLGDFICCSLAVNVESLDINGEKIENFLNSYDEICNKEFEEEELDLLAGVLQFDRILIEKSIKNYRFCPRTDIDEIKAYIRESGINLSEESLSGVLDIEYLS